MAKHMDLQSNSAVQLLALAAMIPPCASRCSNALPVLVLMLVDTGAISIPIPSCPAVVAAAASMQLRLQPKRAGASQREQQGAL